jgi:hypothetical protein
MVDRFLRVRWLSLFADVPDARVDTASRFWCGITGARPGARSGDHGEYLPLELRTGDRSLWIQGVGRSVGGWHLDLHVLDVDAATALAVVAGARVVRHTPGLATLVSPGGQPFCIASEDGSRARRPVRPVSWPDGHRSLVDQICLDIPSGMFEEEADFWSRLTGWPRLGSSTDAAVFDRLDVPSGLPLRILLQRLGRDDRDGIRAHADLSSDNPPAELARHAELGADVVRVAPHWTTLVDPEGLTYCITDRIPAAASAGPPRPGAVSAGS